MAGDLLTTWDGIMTLISLVTSIMLLIFGGWLMSSCITEVNGKWYWEQVDDLDLYGSLVSFAIAVYLGCAPWFDHLTADRLAWSAVGPAVGLLVWYMLRLRYRKG